MSYPTAIRNITLQFVRTRKQELGAWRRNLLRLQPWRPVGERDVPVEGAWCVLCRWHGERFEGLAHSESGLCPRCGSIGRDRMLYLSLIQRVPRRHGLRMIETSPRLGEHYRRAMRRRADYVTSDYDQRAHTGTIKLDLEKIDLPDDSLDVLLTAHVLEHVPDTDAALGEIYRVLRPGGHMLLQVPLLQAVTAPPTEPEFHEDNTPVFWRFGLDLTERLREHGLTTELLVTEELARRVAARDVSWPDPLFPEVDADELVLHADPADLTVVASDALASRAWLRPCYMFAVWHCVKPS
ncbi:MAG TPA: class I SAM-dependent methyltransferase [Actinomycetes bacterium]|nr:class I SAM-dependent methyltransferase [Actinomycetes bacterium]